MIRAVRMEWGNGERVSMCLLCVVYVGIRAGEQRRRRGERGKERSEKRRGIWCHSALLLQRFFLSYPSPRPQAPSLTRLLASPEATQPGGRWHHLDLTASNGCYPRLGTGTLFLRPHGKVTDMLKPCVCGFDVPLSSLLPALLFSFSYGLDRS